MHSNKKPVGKNFGKTTYEHPRQIEKKQQFNSGAVTNSKTDVFFKCEYSIVQFYNI